MRRGVGDLSTQGSERQQKGMRRTVEEAHARHAEKLDWQSGQVRGKGQASCRACCAILDHVCRSACGTTAERPAEDSIEHSEWEAAGVSRELERREDEKARTNKNTPTYSCAGPGSWSEMESSRYKSSCRLRKP